MITLVTFIIVQFVAVTLGFLHEMLGWLLNAITAPLAQTLNWLAEYMSELRVQLHSETMQRQTRIAQNKAKAALDEKQ